MGTIIFVGPVCLLTSLAVFASGNPGCPNGTGEMGKGWNQTGQNTNRRSAPETEISRNILAVALLLREARISTKHVSLISVDISWSLHDLVVHILHIGPLS